MVSFLRAYQQCPRSSRRPILPRGSWYCHDLRVHLHFGGPNIGAHYWSCVGFPRESWIAMRVHPLKSMFRCMLMCYRDHVRSSNLRLCPVRLVLALLARNINTSDTERKSKAFAQDHWGWPILASTRERANQPQQYCHQISGSSATVYPTSQSLHRTPTATDSSSEHSVCF